MLQTRPELLEEKSALRAAIKHWTDGTKGIHEGYDPNISDVVELVTVLGNVSIRCLCIRQDGEQTDDIENIEEVIRNINGLSVRASENETLFNLS